MGNAFISKGSAILLGTGSTEIKAIVIDDVDLGTGEQTNESDVGSDGTKYSYVGEQEDTIVEVPILLTDDLAETVLTEVYGAPSIVGSVKTWNMKNAGSSNTRIAIESLDTTGSQNLKFQSVNAKALVLNPTMEQGKGFPATLRILMDYWQAKLTDNS